MKISKEILTFFAFYSGDSEEDIEKAWFDWYYKQHYSSALNMDDLLIDMNEK
jgi:hypothetical protein